MVFCSTVLSLDATDLSGEHMPDISHNIVKVKLDPNGVPYGSQDKISGMAYSFLIATLNACDSRNEERLVPRFAN
jgi:hypothetical protein